MARTIIKMIAGILTLPPGFREGRRSLFVYTKEYYKGAIKIIPLASPEEADHLRRYLRDYAAQLAKRRIEEYRIGAFAGLVIAFSYYFLAWGPAAYFPLEQTINQLCFRAWG
jgi:hypothetical protein